jgi:hypothetical protein
MPSIHTVICTVIRYVPLSKTLCELHSVSVVTVTICTHKYENICEQKFPGEKVIYPNDCLHLLYKEIIFISGMKPLQVTDIFGRRDQFPI